MFGKVPDFNLNFIFKNKTQRQIHISLDYIVVQYYFAPHPWSGLVLVKLVPHISIVMVALKFSCGNRKHILGDMTILFGDLELTFKIHKLLTD